MRRLAAVLGVAGAAWAGAAQATGSIECTAVDAPDVMASVLVSRAEANMVIPLRAEFNIGGTTYATEAEDGMEPVEGATTIVPVHQYGDAYTTIVEYADENVEALIISLRLARGAAGDAYALAGVLTLRDEGAWAVTCLEG